jgi:hypothetical protein
MAHDIGAFFQNVLFVSRLPGVIVVNDVGHSVFISPVGHDADMLLKNHKIPALPFLGPGHIRGQYNRMMRKKHLQISHPAKINVGIRLPDIVPLRMLWST